VYASLRSSQLEHRSRSRTSSWEQNHNEFEGKFQINKVKTIALHHTDVINNHPQYQLHSGIVIGLVGNETLSVPRQRKAIKLSADSMKYKFAEYIDELITLNESKEMIPPEGV
jgi:hypothetical protein